MSGTVYLLHFERPLHHARHYMGWASNLGQRLQQHSSGRGARLMEVITELGIRWRLARIWKGTRELERQLKNRKEAPRLCPICKRKGGGQ